MGIILSNFTVYSDIIETPEHDERNTFVIDPPDGLGYRTFAGKNGLISVLWPSECSFNSSDTAIFVFIQNNNEPLPDIPDNINLFMEKCPQANFKFASPKDRKDETLSISERYFSGRCGLTMILFKEDIGNLTLVVLLASAKYVSSSQMADAKAIVAAYTKEITKHK